MGVHVVATGSWVYDGAVALPVWIARTTFDFWYEVAAADGTLEPDEAPHLNDEGSAYYVVFRQQSSSADFWPDGGGFHTLVEAQQAAAKRVPADIRWDAC